jgi:hypothetical protein
MNTKPGTEILGQVIRTRSLGSPYLAYVRDPDGNKLCTLHIMR